MSHLPVSDSEAVPHFAKLFIEVEVKSNLVLHLDALLNHNLLQVSLKAHLLEKPPRASARFLGASRSRLIRPFGAMSRSTAQRALAPSLGPQ